MSNSYFTEPQVAAAIKVDVRTMRRWRKDGKIKYQRTPGGRIRYSLDDLIELQASMTVDRGQTQSVD